MKHLPPTADSFHAVAAAAGRLLGTLERLTDTDVAAPSRLPGWSRGHVLSHLACQAPALERLLDWARTGAENPQYAGRQARDREIEAGARRPAADLVADVIQTAARFQQAIEQLPLPAWKAPIRPFTGELCTPERILVIRLRELEVHHVDLDLGYEFTDIPDPALRIVLDDVTGYLAAAPDTPDFVLRDDEGSVLRRFGAGGPTVYGTRAEVLAWLTGRSTGGRLDAPRGLPALPGWI